MVADQLIARGRSRIVPTLIGFQRRIFRTRLLRYKGDFNIEYLELSPEKKETLVFLHGFGDTKDSFLRSAVRLSRHYRVIIPDMPGFGETVRDYARTYTLENYSQWMAGFIRHFGEKVHLAGNSLGGATALLVALEARDSLRSLTVIDPAGIFDENIRCIYDMILEGHNIFSVRNRAEFERLLELVFHRRPKLPDMVFDYMFHRFLKSRQWHEKLIQDLMHGARVGDDIPDPGLYSLNERIKGIRVPTLVMWGDRDQIFPVGLAQIAHSGIPGANLHIFSNTGHSVQVEYPGKFVRVFREFQHSI